VIAADTEFASFSHPALDPSSRQKLHSRLVINAARSQTVNFLRVNGRDVTRASAALADVVSSWCQSQATITEAMQLPLILRLVRSRDIDAVWIAAQFAAHLHSEGRGGEWSVFFERPASIAFGWRLTPPSKNIAVYARGQRECVEVSLDVKPPIEASLIPEATRFFELGSASIPILGRDTQFAFPVDDRAGFANVCQDDLAATLSETASIFARYAPHYLDWVREAVSAIVPIPCPGDDFYQSFSIPGINGLVFASFPAPALKIAELLVHESSHQYYHFAELGTRFTNGIDKAMYPSPYVHKDRPIDRILIAFHAFANIVLFYRACLKEGMRESRALMEKEIESHLQCLRPMSRHLERSPGLTPAGLSFFEPLREELFR
jgi:hypothetical protein